MLSPSAELSELNTTNLSPIEAPFYSVKSKKRKRSRKSGELSDNNPHKKTVTKTPKKTSNPVSNICSKDMTDDKSPQNMEENEVELSPELKELEKRLNTSMLININKCIAEALQPIKDSIEKIVNSSTQIDSHDNEIKRLNVENSALKTQVTELRNDMESIKTKLNQLENKSLEFNLIFRGVEESLNETEDVLKDKIHRIISDTYNYQDEQSHLSAARCCIIRRCKRLGGPNPHRPRPISVEFESKKDVDAILEYKYYLPKGIFADKEYCVDTERRRRILRPILCAAKMKPDLKLKSHMEYDKLVIDGKRYGMDHLDKLPQTISPINVSTKSNDKVFGFFGELCPLSNFHPANFIHEGQSYHSSEQFIQHAKAQYFNDQETAQRILNAQSALACKQLGYYVKNFNQENWVDSIETLCKDGIRAKFEQNPSLPKVLLSTGDKTIVESSKDNVWGTGIALFRWDCLNERLWSSKGKLGVLLMEIRDTHKFGSNAPQ